MSHTRRDVLQMLAAGAPLAALPLTGSSSPPHLDRWLEPESKASGKFDIVNPVSVTEVDYQLPGAWRLAAAAQNTSTITLTTQPDDVLANRGWAVVEPFSIRCEIRRITGVVETGDVNDANNPPQRQLTLDDTLTKQHAANVAVLWTANPVWDITLFGAKVDGHTATPTDDRPAFDAAIADCNRAGGGVVKVPSGTTLVKLNEWTNSDSNHYRAVSIMSNVTIEGNGDSSIVKLYGHAAHYRAIFANHGQTIDNFALRNLKVDCNGTENPHNNQDPNARNGAVAITSGENIRIENVTFDDSDCINLLWFAPQTGATRLGNIHIDQCRFTNINAAAGMNTYHDLSVIYMVHITGTARVTNCDFYGTVGKASCIAAMETHTSNVIFTGNYVHGFAVAFQQGGTNKSAGNKTEWQIIANNRFVDCFNGIDISSHDGLADPYNLDTGDEIRNAHLLVTDNTFNLDLDGWAQAVGTNGHKKDIRSQAIRFDSTSMNAFAHIVIRGNDITYSTMTADTANYETGDWSMCGIYIDSIPAANVVVMYPDNWQGITIENNIIKRSPSAGIWVGGNSDSQNILSAVTIRNNVIINPGNHPVVGSIVLDKHRAGIHLAPYTALNWIISGNIIHSDLGTPKIKYGIYGETTGGTLSGVSVVDNEVRVVNDLTIPAYHWAGGSSIEAPFVRMRTRQTTTFTTPTFPALVGSEILHTSTGKRYVQDAADANRSGASWVELRGYTAPSAGIGNTIATYQALPGLRGFWPLNLHDSSDNVLDLSGNGRTLTNNGSTGFDQTGLVTIANFDSVTKYLSRADEAATSITGALTFGCWLYLPNAQTMSVFPWGKYLTTGNQRSYAFRINANGSVNVIICHTDGSLANTLMASTASSAAATGIWYFAAARFTPLTELALFWRSASTGAPLSGGKTTNTTSIPAAIYDSTALLTAGAMSGGNNNFVGYLAFPFVCAAAVSDAALENLYNQSRALFL